MAGGDTELMDRVASAMLAVLARLDRAREASGIAPPDLRAVYVQFIDCFSPFSRKDVVANAVEVKVVADRFLRLAKAYEQKAFPGAAGTRTRAAKLTRNVRYEHQRFHKPVAQLHRLLTEDFARWIAMKRLQTTPRLDLARPILIFPPRQGLPSTLLEGLNRHEPA